MYSTAGNSQQPSAGRSFLIGILALIGMFILVPIAMVLVAMLAFGPEIVAYIYPHVPHVFG